MVVVVGVAFPVACMSDVCGVLCAGQHVSLMGFDGSLASSLLPRHVSRLLTGRQSSSPTRPLDLPSSSPVRGPRYGFDESDLVVFYYGLFSDLAARRTEAGAEVPVGGVGPSAPLPRLLHVAPPRLPHFPWPVFHMVSPQPAPPPPRAPPGAEDASSVCAVSR